MRARARPPALGPYNVSEVSVSVPALDRTDPSVWIVYPNTTAGATFPLITYLHGLLGGDIDLLGYAAHFGRLASHGFVVVAADSCDVGCTDAGQGAPYSDCGGVPDVRPANQGWGFYYAEAFKAVEFMRNASSAAGAGEPYSRVDWAAGVGLAGHSMGGQGATIGACAACAARWGVRAAVLHHAASAATPAGNLGAKIAVPTLGMATTGDSIWPETEAIMNATRAAPLPHGFRNEVGWSHLEPVLLPPVENPLLATYTAAWFKVFLNNETAGAYHDLIFGVDENAMCTHAPMQTCYVDAGPAARRGE